MVSLFGKNCVGVATFWRLILSHSWILKRIMINRTKLASSAQFLKVRAATSLHLVPSLAENSKMVLLFGKNCVGVATFWRLILSHSWILKRIMINRTKLASSWQFLKIRVATSLNLVPAFAKSTEAVLHFGTNYVSLAISVVSGAKFCPWLGKGGGSCVFETLKLTCPKSKSKDNMMVSCCKIDWKTSSSKIEKSLLRVSNFGFLCFFCWQA